MNNYSSKRHPFFLDGHLDKRGKISYLCGPGIHGMRTGINGMGAKRNLWNFWKESASADSSVLKEEIVHANSDVVEL